MGACLKYVGCSVSIQALSTPSTPPRMRTITIRVDVVKVRE